MMAEGMLKLDKNAQYSGLEAAKSLLTATVTVTAGQAPMPSW